MEEYEVEMFSGDIVIYLRFSSDEKNELRCTLKGVAPPGAIEAFIAGAEALCSTKKEILMAQLPPAKARDARKQLLRDCRKALKTLGRFACIEDGNGPYEGLFCIEDIVDWGPGFGVEHEIFMEAGSIYFTLRSFVEKLEKFHRHEEKDKRKQGRPEADKDRFIRSIKWVYEEYIGPATLYEDGSFFQVVRLLLSFVGLPSEYPTKSIRAALKGAPIDLRGTGVALWAGFEYIKQTQGTEQDKKAFVKKHKVYHEQRLKAEDEQRKKYLLTLKKEPTE